MSFHGRFSPENKALKNAANGYAGLDGSSKLTVGQLPLATGAAAGAVIVGTNLTVTAGTLSLSNANVLAAIGFTPAGLTGNTFTGTQVMPVGTTTVPSLRIPHGAAPTTPTNGDVWSTTAALFVRLNGTTATLAQLGAQSFTGLQTFGAGLTVSAGTITLPANSIADAALTSNVPLKNGTNVYTGSNEFQGLIKQGDGNQDILEKKSAEIETHDRNTVTAVSANIITSITERDGVTVVKTTTFSYLGSGNLNTIVIVAGGKTTTVTYSYDGNGNFTGTTRTVV